MFGRGMAIALVLAALLAGVAEGTYSFIVTEEHEFASSTKRLLGLSYDGVDVISTHFDSFDGSLAFTFMDTDDWTGNGSVWPDSVEGSTNWKPWGVAASSSTEFDFVANDSMFSTLYCYLELPGFDDVLVETHANPGYDWARGMDLGPDGYYYQVDTHGSNPPRLFRMNSNFVPVSTMELTEMGDAEPTGLTAFYNGTTITAIVLAQPDNLVASAWIYDIDGSSATLVQQVQMPWPYQMQASWGLTNDGAGNFYWSCRRVGATRIVTMTLEQSGALEQMTWGSIKANTH